MQGPIVFLDVAPNFEHNLNVLCHSLQVSSCRSNHVCRVHLVRCDKHISAVIGQVLFGHCALLWLWVGRPYHVNAFRALACLPSPLLKKGTHF